MRVDVRAVRAHPTVLVLDEPSRLVLLALLRAANEWGEMTAGEAVATTRATLAACSSTETPRAVLARLHTVRLVHRDGGSIVCWTPRQHDDAAAFAMTDRELAALETEVNGPIPGLTAAASEVL